MKGQYIINWKENQQIFITQAVWVFKTRLAVATVYPPDTLAKGTSGKSRTSEVEPHIQLKNWRVIILRKFFKFYSKNLSRKADKMWAEIMQRRMKESRLDVVGTIKSSQGTILCQFTLKQLPWHLMSMCRYYMNRGTGHVKPISTWKKKHG